ncbi:MAG TPA: caspase family protein, partial [Azospirillaceae bacterium]|nr:caspase family protein [Azospirillaceae bacterium]
MALFGGTVWAQGPAPADPGKRVALVIGIGRYQYAPPLPNPPNDARAIAAALRQLGFEVDEQVDLDARDLTRALREFGLRASVADVALVYFAGHGLQVGGQNYLIPADARLERVRDLLYEALPLNLFMGELAQAKQLGILMLDACRNNPFVQQLAASGDPGKALAVQAGLARVEDTPSDTLVAMATRADAVAEDGAGNHSPYTAALLEQLAEPGLELSLFFRRVRDNVLKTTNGRQEPYIFGSLGATPFYFNPLPANS